MIMKGCKENMRKSTKVRLIECETIDTIFGMRRPENKIVRIGVGRESKSGKMTTIHRYVYTYIRKRENSGNR